MKKKKEKSELELLREENEKLRVKAEISRLKRENMLLKLKSKGYFEFFETDDAFYTDKGWVNKKLLDAGEF